MENLETQKEAISLGKSYVKELKLEPGVDTFSRWMVHYIAEKVIMAEKGFGDEKEDTIQDCEQIIIRLWDHRRSRYNYKDTKEIDKEFIRNVFTRIGKTKTV